MRELPMLLRGDMVRATTEGRKVMTRRPVKPQPEYGAIHCLYTGTGWGLMDEKGRCTCEPVRPPFGAPGDLLYVRETTQRWGNNYAQYQATLTPVIGDREHMCNGRAVWWYSRDVCPSIHMPKWAARTWCRVTDVRVERVQDISPADCEAEGIEGKTSSAPGCGRPYDEYTNGDGITYSWPRYAFAALWDSIYAKRGLGWDANPWAWVTSYEVTER